jgi:hypothetical protein
MDPFHATPDVEVKLPDDGVQLTPSYEYWIPLIPTATMKFEFAWAAFAPFT